MKEFTKLHLTKLEETLKDFKVLLSRYREVKDDPEKLRIFLSRNRNQIFDLTNNKHFRPGFESKRFIEERGNYTDDHYYQRTSATSIIFSELDKNPKMNLNTFIKLVKKYGSTVRITKNEHKLISGVTKNTKILNYTMYDKLGIELEGFDKYLIENNLH